MPQFPCFCRMCLKSSAQIVNFPTNPSYGQPIYNLLHPFLLCMGLNLSPAFSPGLTVILDFSSEKPLHQNAVRPLPTLFLNFWLCLLLYRKFLGYPRGLWLCLSDTDAWLLCAEDTPPGVLVGLSPDWMKLLATHHTTASKSEPEEKNSFVLITGKTRRANLRRMQGELKTAFI